MLVELAQIIGLDRAGFTSALEKTQGDVTSAHIQETRHLMSEVGVSGFPSFVLEKEGNFSVLDISGYLGRPDAWQALLEDSN